MRTGPIACAEADLDVGAGLKSRVGPDCRQEPDVQFRMDFLKLRQGWGDDENSFGNRRPNGYGAGRSVAEEAVRGDDKVLQGLAYRRQISPATGGKLQLSRRAFEKLMAELAFQCADVRADSGLGEAEFRACCGEAAQPADGFEASQPNEIGECRHSLHS